MIDIVIHFLLLLNAWTAVVHIKLTRIEVAFHLGLLYRSDVFPVNDRQDFRGLCCLLCLLVSLQRFPLPGGFSLFLLCDDCTDCLIVRELSGYEPLVYLTEPASLVVDRDLFFFEELFEFILVEALHDCQFLLYVPTLILGLLDWSRFLIFRH